jgi:hypothetical protein
MSNQSNDDYGKGRDLYFKATVTQENGDLYTKAKVITYLKKEDGTFGEMCETCAKAIFNVNNLVTEAQFNS